MPSILKAVKAKCRIDTHGKTVHFKAHLTKGQGKMNGKAYYGGETIPSMAVSNGQVFNFEANASAAGDLTLIKESGSPTVTAHCDVTPIIF